MDGWIENVYGICPSWQQRRRYAVRRMLMACIIVYCRQLSAWLGVFQNIQSRCDTCTTTSTYGEMKYDCSILMIKLARIWIMQLREITVAMNISWCVCVIVIFSSNTNKPMWGRGNHTFVSPQEHVRCCTFILQRTDWLTILRMS